MLLNLDHVLSGIKANCWEMWIWNPWRFGGCPQSVGHSQSLRVSKIPRERQPSVERWCLGLSDGELPAGSSRSW